MKDLRNRNPKLPATGPRTLEGKQIASQNARKHGLLSKTLIFETDAERAEYDEVASRLRESLRPADPLEEMFVDEITVCWWQLRNCQRTIERLLRDRASRDIKNTIRHFSRNSEIFRIPLPGIGTLSSQDSEAARTSGWDCEKLVLRLGIDDKEQTSTNRGTVIDEDEASGNSSAEKYCVEIEMSPSLDKMIRYQTKIKRDLYQALEQLKRLRELRVDR